MDRSDRAVASRTPAEDMPFDAMRQTWIGINQTNPFFTYDRCRVCGLLFNPVYCDDGQLASLYKAMPPNMNAVPTGETRATQNGYFSHAVKALGRHLDGGYLEIGPDIGFIVNQAAIRGAFDRFWLIEPNQTVHHKLKVAANGRPVEIMREIGGLAAVPDRSVGLAVMVHVLDHLLDPLAVMVAVRRKLRPGGQALIVVHNEASLLRQVLGRRWPPFCLQHPQLFNPQSICRLLDRAGFGEVAISPGVNHFPLDFLIEQAGEALGLRAIASKLRLPKTRVSLQLGNMLILAQAPVQAASQRRAASAA
eukprot:gene10332-10398_t